MGETTTSVPLLIVNSYQLWVLREEEEIWSLIDIYDISIKLVLLRLLTKQFSLSQIVEQTNFFIALHSGVYTQQPILDC
jgi:hypothetical protein